MAKKVVATLKTGTGKQFTKCIKMAKPEKTGAYMFTERVIANDQVQDLFVDKQSRILRLRLLNTKGISSGGALCV